MKGGAKAPFLGDYGAPRGIDAVFDVDEGACKRRCSRRLCSSSKPFYQKAVTLPFLGTLTEGRFVVSGRQGLPEMDERAQDTSKRHTSATGWWSRERVLVIVLAAGTAIAFYLCYLLVRPLLPTLAWALALAVIAYPLHAWVANRIRHPNVAAGLAILMVAVVIVAPSIFVTERLVRQAVEGIQTMKDEAATGRWKQVLEANPRVAPLVRWAERQIDWKGATERVAGALTERASSWVTGSIWALVELLMVFLVLFYFFRDRALALAQVRSLLPLSRSEMDEMFERVESTIQATIYGTLAVALVQGALGGVMFWWLGLPAPLVWGVVMALLAIVPVLGASVVWVPAAVFLALQGSWGSALILAAWGTIVISLIDNWLYPILVGHQLRIHTLTVFVAIVGGLIAFGASGLILGPVIVAVTLALIDVWRLRTAGGKTAETARE